MKTCLITFKVKSIYTVTSRLFTHIVSTEKMRKDTRGTKYTYYNGCFLVLLLVKNRLRTFTL